MNSYLLMLTFRVWLIELPVAAVNWFLLARHVYRPRWGDLRAHRVAMTTRIGWIVVLAYLLLHVAGTYTVPDTLVAGLFWMLLWLAFEWAGSLLVRRPVHEILAGWHVERGYLWPYVLAAYLLAPVVVGPLVPGGGRS